MGRPIGGLRGGPRERGSAPQGLRRAFGGSHEAGRRNLGSGVRSRVVCQGSGARVVIHHGSSSKQNWWVNEDTLLTIGATSRLPTVPHAPYSASPYITNHSCSTPARADHTAGAKTAQCPGAAMELPNGCARSGMSAYRVPDHAARGHASPGGALPREPSGP